MKRNRPSPRIPHRLLIGAVGAVSALASTSCQLLTSELGNKTGELLAFSSCTDLESHLKSQALRSLGILDALGGSGYNPLGFASAVGQGNVDPNRAGTPTSDTNNQEAGVDEADILQVDATHAFALSGRRLVIIEALGTGISGGGSNEPAALSDANINGGQVVAEVDLEGTPVEMFLMGDRVVVITRLQHRALAQAYSAASRPERSDGAPTTMALVFDVSDRRNPQKVREVALDGEYIAARRIDDQVYLVARAMLGGPADDEGEAAALGDWLDLGSASLLGASLDSWMPYVYTTTFDNGAVGAQSVDRASCSDAYASPASPGEEVLGIVSFDALDADSQPHTTTILGDGSLVYASTESIIVALTNYADLTYSVDEDDPALLSLADDLGIDLSGLTGIDLTASLGEDGEASGPATYLHRFALADDGRAEYDATGEVDGWILNQFSISEEDGYVRVATQANRDSLEAETMVFTLRAGGAGSDPGLALSAVTSAANSRLRVAGELRNIAPGEDLFAVRFQGDKGYLVTFQEVDPLWIVDLSNPESPRMRGNLMVPGWSTYLHPLSGGRLLAIGQGGFWNDEIKLSLFDVSNADAPRNVEEVTVGESGATSEALTEHRAFRYLEDRQLLAIPVQESGASALHLFRVGSAGFEEVATVDHSGLGGGTVRRAYQIGDYLYSLSDGGVVITNLDTFQTAANVDL